MYHILKSLTLVKGTWCAWWCTPVFHHVEAVSQGH